MKEKIDKADDKVIKFRQQKGIILAEDEKSIIEDIKSYRSQIDYLRVQKQERQAAINSIRKQLENMKPYTVSVLKYSGDRSVAALKKKLDSLLVRYTENYPEVVKLKAEIEALKKRGAAASAENPDNATPEQSTVNPIYQELTQNMLQSESELESLSAKQKQLVAMLHERESELKNMPENKKILAALESERNAQVELYNKLVQRQGQSEVSKEMEVGDKSTTFRVVDPAVVPLQPFSPNRSKMFIMALFLGLAGGLGGVYVREGFDTTVRQEKALRDLGLQILAVIPNIFDKENQEKKKKGDRLLYVVAGSYFLVVCMTALLDVMGFSYIDRIVGQLHLSSLYDSIKNARSLF
jgi:polysaccharide chain length determinant protein (PEP-CTERM system associated)